MKKLLAVAAVAAFVLVGCGNSHPADPSDDPFSRKIGRGADEALPFRIKVQDGRTIQCIWVDGFKAGGLSCDWSSK